MGEIIPVPPKTKLFAEGDPGDSLFIILSGAVRIYKTAGTHVRTLSVRRNGEFLGEMALLEDKPRSASAITTQRTHLFRLSRECFLTLIASRPPVAIEILTVLSGRMRDTQDGLMRDLARKNQELERFNALLEKKVARTTKELRLANRCLREMSIRDGLTGVYNRRYFQETIDSLFDRSPGAPTAISLLMFDIDHFKRLNDTHGHQAGDRVLAEVALIIGDHLRRGHILARYGGEEFALIMKGVRRKRAAALADEIRSAVESHTFPIREFHAGEKVTVSTGVASFPEDCGSAKDLIHAADCALYHAKHTGRNRVVLFTPDLAQSPP
jgi:diguanylate cyclase (GGDEF)-like protein